MDTLFGILWAPFGFMLSCVMEIHDAIWGKFQDLSERGKAGRVVERKTLDFILSFPSEIERAIFMKRLLQLHPDWELNFRTGKTFPDLVFIGVADDIADQIIREAGSDAQVHFQAE